MTEGQKHWTKQDRRKLHPDLHPRIQSEEIPHTTWGKLTEITKSSRIPNHLKGFDPETYIIFIDSLFWMMEKLGMDKNGFSYRLSSGRNLQFESSLDSHTGKGNLKLGRIWMDYLKDRGYSDIRIITKGFDEDTSTFEWEKKLYFSLLHILSHSILDTTDHGDDFSHQYEKLEKRFPYGRFKRYGIKTP